MRSKRRENRDECLEEGVKQMKIVVAEAVVPMVSVHKVG